MVSDNSASSKYSSPIDGTTAARAADLNGKTAVVTGGSNGIGAQYVKGLVAAGANVCIGDIDDAGAKSLQEEFGDKVSFSKCSVIEWTDQVTLFSTALKHTGRIDIVIANAGVSGSDVITDNESDSEIPSKPDLRILDVNLTGVMYTTKLALHYFKRQHRTSPSTDTVLIIQGSLAGYLDIPNNSQYTTSKWGVRGLLHTLRASTLTHGTRVNYIAPWFVKTAILGEGFAAYLEAKNVEFATVEDAAAAMHRLLGRGVHGRTLAIVPRSFAPDTGYLDCDVDACYAEGTELFKMQRKIDGILSAM